MLDGEQRDVVPALLVDGESRAGGDAAVVAIEEARGEEAAEDDAEAAGEEAEADLEGGVEGVAQGEDGGEGGLVPQETDEGVPRTGGLDGVAFMFWCW